MCFFYAVNSQHRKEHKKMKHIRKKNSKTLQVNQVPIAFSKKPITAWGGLASIVGKLLEVIEFRSWVENAIPIHERSNNAKGIYEKILATFLTVLCGGERFSHLSWWGHGIKAIKKAFAVEWLPKASSTLTRFWGRIDRQSLSEKLGEAARQLAVTIIRWEKIVEDNLNLDSSVLVRYGNQQGAKRGYNPKKRGRPSHHPLIAFLGCGYVVNVWNRSGNTGTGQGAVDFFRQTRLALGNVFCVNRVLCDSGFYLIDFIVHLESGQYSYIIAVPISQAMQRKIVGVKDWKRICEGIEAGEFEFEHTDQKWTHPRRYVVVRQSVHKRPKASGKQLSLFQDLEDWSKYRISVMITNDPDSTPEEIWREYRPRANDENVIKDLKEGYGFETFNLQNFWATEAVLTMIGLVFHNLIVCLNRSILNPNRPQERLKTLRHKYFIIPGLLGGGGGKKVLRLSVQEKRMKAKVVSIIKRIYLLSHGLNCIAVDQR
jgi:hypothetical protein